MLPLSKQCSGLLLSLFLSNVSKAGKLNSTREIGFNVRHTCRLQPPQTASKPDDVAIQLGHLSGQMVGKRTSMGTLC